MKGLRKFALEQENARLADSAREHTESMRQNAGQIDLGKELKEERGQGKKEQTLGGGLHLGTWSCDMAQPRMLMKPSISLASVTSDFLLQRLLGG